MKTIYKTLVLLFFIAITITNLKADNKIKVKLLQPPPNMLGVKDLWKLDITNTTREKINIYLTGTATESRKGLIVSGKSKVFSASPGTKTYTYDDFKSGEVSWKDKSIQEALLRTGNVPEGEYTICVTAFYENNEVADQESCIEQSIRQSGSITLISPEDGEDIDPRAGVNFVWTGTGLKGPYTLRIVELKGSEEPPPPEAMKEHHPFFEQKEIKGNSFQYPITGPKFEAGKNYAWMVSSGNVKSEVSTIKFKKNDSDNRENVTKIIFPREKDTIFGESLCIIWKNIDKGNKEYTYNIKVYDAISGKEIFSKNKISDSLAKVENFRKRELSRLTIELYTQIGSTTISKQNWNVQVAVVCFLYPIDPDAGTVNATIYALNVTNPSLPIIEDVSVPATDWLTYPAINIPTPYYYNELTIWASYTTLPVSGQTKKLRITIQDLGYPLPLWYACDPLPGNLPCDYTAYWYGIRCSNFNNNSAPVIDQPSNGTGPFQSIAVDISTLISGHEYLLKVFEDNGTYNPRQSYLFQLMK
jgi:hypothetical protein